MNKVNKILENTLFREFSLYSFSTLLFQASRVLVELAAAKILGPAIWGVWYFLNLAIAYRSFTYLGIVNGMNREVPIKLGGDRKEEAEELKNATFSIVTISAALTSAALFISTLLINDEYLIKTIYFLIPLFITTQFYYLVNAKLRAEALFEKISQIQIIFALAFPILAIPLSVIIGLEGFILGFTLALATTLIFAYRKGLFDYSFYFDSRKIKKLISVGFPIMLIGITYTFLSTADRWIIGLLIGTEALGYYSLAIIVFSAMSLFPRVISEQLYPKMAFDWGKTKSRDALEKWVDLQTKYTAYMIIPVLTIVLFTVPKIIRLWLPEYEPGISAIQIIVFGALFKPFSAGWGNVLNIIDKQTWYLAIIIIAVIINLGLNYVLVLVGYGIEGVALGTALTYC
ncbi:MAG: oligosaccharide flippase family protein, partial [Candidatus Paceibacterota bacterium]